MKQKLICLTHTISKFHTKKLCKMVSLIIISMFLLSSCFSKLSSSDKTTTKETKQERQAREKKENITELLKEQANTSSSSIKKKVKKLDMEGNEVYTILFDEITNIYTADKLLEKHNTISSIKNLCELYQENYPESQNTKTISSILSTITTYDDNKSTLTNLNSMYPNGIEESYNNFEYKEFYVLEKLKTQYTDNIAGSFQKEIDSYSKQKNEFLATDVKYDSFWGESADRTYYYIIQPISSFPKEGVYNLYVVENGSRTLVDSDGFNPEASIYQQIDVEELDKNLKNYYDTLKEQENLQKQLAYLLNDIKIQETTPKFQDNYQSDINYNNEKNGVNHNQVAETEFENINLFLSNFSEVGLPYFSSENYDRSELIRFAVIHHILNTNKVQYVIDGVDGISASTITDTIKKYFDIAIYPPTSEDSPEAIEYGIYYLEPDNIYYWDSSVEFDLCYFTSLDTVTVDNNGNYVVEASVYYAPPGNINSSTYANPPSSTTNAEYNYSILATLEPRNGSYILKNYEFI